MHVYSSSEDNIHPMSEDVIEKVDDFQYLEDFKNSSNDMEKQIRKAQGKLNPLTKIWRSRVKTEFFDLKNIQFSSY